MKRIDRITFRIISQILSFQGIIKKKIDLFLSVKLFLQGGINFRNPVRFQKIIHFRFIRSQIILRTTETQRHPY